MHGAALLVAALLAPGADTLTPDGPATLYDDWHGGHTAEGLAPQLLTGFKVTVGPGGRAGTIRLRLAAGSRTLVRRELRFRRAGARELRLRIPRSRTDPLAGRELRLTARSRTAITRVRLQPSY